MPSSPEAVLDMLLNRGVDGEVIESESRRTFSDKEMGLLMRIGELHCRYVSLNSPNCDIALKDAID